MEWLTPYKLDSRDFDVKDTSASSGGWLWLALSTLVAHFAKCAAPYGVPHVTPPCYADDDHSCVNPSRKEIGK